MSPSHGVSSGISIRVFRSGVQIAAPVGGSILGERGPTAVRVTTPPGASSEANRGGGANARSVIP